MPEPVAAYLTDLHTALGHGVPETSGYPALRNLLNAVGDSLKPKITAVIHPSNTGAGLPDGAIFSAKELRKYGDAANLLGLKPDLKVRQDVKGLGELAVKPTGGSEKHPAPDLALVARWGYAGQGGVVMPGPGTITSGTRGDGFLDIHLNATTRWKDVPEAVWNYTLGGYQVLKKWLSYRESALLGRALTSDEAQEFTHNVRRIAAILALQPELDAHYQASI